MDAAVFIVSAIIVLTGAVGVIIAKNPVHSALMLVMTLFGVAVLFILLEAEFLAAIQVIVYAGAIVILFLFVIMLLGVDRSEALGIEPLMGQRPLAAIGAAGTVAMVLVAVLIGTDTLSSTASGPAIDADTDTTRQLGEHLFTDYVVAFQLTAVLLTVAVVGAVALSRKLRSLPTLDDTSSEEVEA